MIAFFLYYYDLPGAGILGALYPLPPPALYPVDGALYPPPPPKDRIFKNVIIVTTGKNIL